jgi:RNA polymerase sigma-70 factor (ECF subfamily)
VSSAANAISDALASSRGELVGFVRKRAGHLVDPEDVVHRVAERALAAGSLRDPRRARAWLFRITRNELADELRRIGLPADELPDDLPDPEPPPFGDGRPCQCGLDIAKALRPDYAAILERAVIDDVPVTEVARELGITPNNATVRLHRARKALRAAVAERCGTTKLHECMECSCDESGRCCATR